MNYTKVAFFLSSVAIPAGLLIVGWAVEYEAHWIWTDIVGVILTLVCTLC